MAETYPFSESRLVIFSRAPVPGRSKTRLIPVIGAEGAAQLHSAMLSNLVDELVTACLAPIDLYCYPDCNHSELLRLHRNYGVQLHQQCGADLGERMGLALEQALTNAHYALLFGTDCPDLDARIIAAALTDLRDGYDAVMLPVEDGGYVAIGLRRPAPWLFENIEWGRPDVAEITRERLRAAGWRWSEPASLWDVDEASDLHRLRESHPQLWHQANRFASSAVRAPGDE